MTKKRVYVSLAVIAVLLLVLLLLIFKFSGSKVLAVVEGEKITEDDYLLELKLNHPDEILEAEVNSEILENLIMRKLILQQAEKKGITVLEEEVNRFLSDTLTRENIDEERFNVLLSSTGLSLKDAMKSFKETLLINKLLKQELSVASISEDELKQFFDEGKDKIIQVHARHVLVCHTESKSLKCESGRSKEEALKRANEVYDKLTKENANFEIIAASMSDEPQSDVTGGDLGFFSKGQMVKEFEDVAFSLNEGEISKPFESPFGYHVVELLERKDSFEEFKESIRVFFEYQAKQQAFEEYVQSLSQKSKIVVK